MALQSRRFPGKALHQPSYNFCDVPYCSKDLAGSTVSVVTERQHLVDSIAELTLVCNEAVRRRKPGAASPTTGGSPTKPLSIEYIFDRIDTDDPIWGLVVRTDTPTSLKGRPSNVKSSPLWKRGMLQGYIAMTTFTNWQSTFRFDSMAEVAFGQDDAELTEQRRRGIRKYDEDGSLAEELEASVKAGNPHLEGIVYPRIAEVSLLGGLGCGKQLMKLLIEHVERLKSSAQLNYDHIVLQATENSIPFYESMGFVRVGCVQGKAPSPNEYVNSPVEEYYTKKNGETPASVAKEFGVDLWDTVFLNRSLWPDLVQKSWLKKGTKLFLPKSKLSAGGQRAPKWYISRNNDTPRSIAKKFQLDFSAFLKANRTRYPEMTGNSKLIEGTHIQISRFDMDEVNTVAYTHWTFPDAEVDDEDAASYMMALKIKDRRKSWRLEAKPVADSLAVPIRPYSPEATGATGLLLQPTAAKVPLAPIFTAKNTSLREPQKPKGPIGTYAYFTAECRSSMDRELEGKKLGEVSKIISEKWRAMSDEDKIPYQERSKDSKAVYNQALAKYEAEMKQYRLEHPVDTPKVGEHVDTSLLEKVVKFKSTSGISGASKFEYYYVLTYIPDLAWVHLIPMRKVGVFGPGNPDACGRPVWMIVGENEGKEIDTTAAVCQPVTALTIKNSADADNEQWDIYDNGETPPRQSPVPIVTLEQKANVSSVPVNLPVPPKKPKRPASSFAFFLGDAMKEATPGMKVAERTKVISEKWNCMADEERQKYKDRHAIAKGEYLKAMDVYKEDLAKFHHENPGIQTPTSTKKIQTPGKMTDGGSKKKKQDKMASGAIGRTPILKQKKAQPTEDPSIHAFNSKTVIHTVKKDPVELEKLLGKLASDSQPYETPGKDDIILSLMDASYKEIMWQHFNILGSTRNSKQESDICNEVMLLLKQKMGPAGKFLKGSSNKYYQVDDDAARAKIIDDIRRRLRTAQTWLKDKESKKSFSSCKKPTQHLSPAMTKSEKSTREPGDNDVILSFLNEEYKNIMWSHFRKIGSTHGDEDELGRTIFQTLKNGLGKTGVFFKKHHHSNTLLQINDDIALQKVTRDLKRRMESCDRWLMSGTEKVPSTEKKPRSSLTGKPRQTRQSPMTHPAAETMPQSSKPVPSLPSKDSKEIVQNSSAEKKPWPSLARKQRQARQQPRNNGVVETMSQLAKPVPSSPSKDSEETVHKLTRPSPNRNAQHLRQHKKIKAASGMKPPLSPSHYSQQGSQPEPKECKRPLAPIFLKSYAKKNKETVSEGSSADHKKSEEAPRRYPQRRKKEVADDSHIVSDDATSSDALEPRKKRAKFRK